MIAITENFQWKDCYGGDCSFISCKRPAKKYLRTHDTHFDGSSIQSISRLCAKCYNEALHKGRELDAGTVNKESALEEAEKCIVP